MQPALLVRAGQGDLHPARFPVGTGSQMDQPQGFTGQELEGSPTVPIRRLLPTGDGGWLFCFSQFLSNNYFENTNYLGLGDGMVGDLF